MAARFPINRASRARRSVNQALRDLAAREGYFPLQTGARQGVRQSGPDVPQAPDNWQGTLPEWAIFYAHGQMELVEGRDFVFQYQVGHPNDPESARLDFYERDIDLGINVNGIFFHYLFGGYKIESDLEQQVRLQASGFQMVYIDELMALNDPVYYLSEARQFRDHSLMARGVA